MSPGRALEGVREAAGVAARDGLPVAADRLEGEGAAVVVRARADS